MSSLRCMVDRTFNLSKAVCSGFHTSSNLPMLPSTLSEGLTRFLLLMALFVSCSLGQEVEHITRESTVLAGREDYNYYIVCRVESIHRFGIAWSQARVSFCGHVFDNRLGSEMIIAIYHIVQ